MDWPELLDHPFWTQVLMEEEGEEEEEDEKRDLEEKISCEGVGSASLRCVDIVFVFILHLLETFCCSHFTTYRCISYNAHINGRCRYLVQSLLIHWKRPHILKHLSCNTIQQHNK